VIAPERQRALLAILEARVARSWQREIARAMRDAASEYSQNQSIMLSMGAHKSRSDRIILVTYETAARQFGKPYYEQGKARKDFQNFTRAMQVFMRNFGAKKVVQITETTEHQIRDVINEGVEIGATLTEIAKEITQRAPAIARTRAPVIARTETHSAAMWSQVEAIKDTGLTLRKQWIATQDARTRTLDSGDFDHADMDGVTVGMDEPFDVDGDLLDFPGDPNGQPGNVINCRCVMNFVE
jgi:uncharacterized protein with gpF-like domain